MGHSHQSDIYSCIWNQLFNLQLTQLPVTHHLGYTLTIRSYSGSLTTQSQHNNMPSGTKWLLTSVPSMCGSLSKHHRVKQPHWNQENSKKDCGREYTRVSTSSQNLTQVYSSIYSRSVGSKYYLQIYSVLTILGGGTYQVSHEWRCL